MDTLRVDICYRPLRIAWAIGEGDLESFRRVAQYSHALWGGRYNPIVIVDREDEAGRLIDLFRADIVLPIGESDTVKDFPKKYPHLINPFFYDSVFMKGSKDYRPWSNVLDVYNAIIYLKDKPKWKEIKDRGIRLFSWQKDDPLTDVFLSQLGCYPPADEVGTDYRELYLESSGGIELTIKSTEPIPKDTINYLGISNLSRYGLKRHYSVYTRRDSPGFFVGSASNFNDLVCHWNLRACDIPLWFVDLEYIDRYVDLIPAWEKMMQEIVANYRHEWDRHLGVWTLRTDLDEACKPFGGTHFMRHHVSDATWNRLNVQAPTMSLGEVSVLGVMGNENGKPKVSFPLTDKPFCGDTWFHQQHLIASLSFIGGLYGDEQHTFDIPYLPELNEFYARTMHFQYDKVRVEPGRIGLVIDAADKDGFLYALRVDALMEKVFGMAGYDSKLSPAGLLMRQLIAQLGGLQGARVFKIPGVRRLLKTHGPSGSLLKKEALALIGGKDPDNPNAEFGHHKNLHIEPRPRGAELTPPSVFGYLVEKGLYRVGADLLCPACGLKSWVPMDSLMHQIKCDLCGHDYDAIRQLVDNDKWHYRRSGVFGVEKNALGAVPVTLTLQQLDTAFHGGINGNMYSPSLELSPKGGTTGISCEVDFVWIVPRAYPHKTVVILGECKDKGPITDGDIDNLKRIADALPRKRFKTFVILSQITPFTVEQAQQAKTLNDNYRQRVILLTSRELEPYHIYERVESEPGVDAYANTPEDMVNVTAQLYFKGEQ